MKPALLTMGLLKRLLAIGALLLSCGLAHAQSSRTWVSGVGDDANPCSRTAPCLTWAGALSKTAPGGEIDALDPGEFGPLTITQSVTLDGSWGHVSGIGATGSADSIAINIPSPGTTGPVILRNLTLNGFNGLGLNGIHIQSAAQVSLDHVDVSGYSQNCLLVDATANNAKISIYDSIFSLCTRGISNNASATLGVSSTLVVLNSGTGVSSTNSQGAVQLFDTQAVNNGQNTSIVNFSSQTPAVGGATSGGTASASISGGAGGCSFASQQFVTPSSVGNGGPPNANPSGAGFQFSTTSCGALSTVTITLNYSPALPAGTQLYKYGPATPGAPISTWFVIPGATLSADGTQFTYTITDNGIGDSNNTVGIINDPVVPALPLDQSIPTLSDFALAALVLLLTGLGAVALRKQSMHPCSGAGLDKRVHRPK